MSMVRTLARSFSGGEITPELYGRIDLTKFQTGLARCENMEVLPHGPLRKRPGLEYVLQAKRTDAVNLIPFSFNTEQTYIVEVGHQYMRFHTQGTTVLDTAVTVLVIDQGNPALVNYSGTDPAEGEWVYLDGGTGATDMNGRYVIATNVNPGANTFEVYDLHGNPVDRTAVGIVSGGTFAPVYEIATLYDQADVFEIDFAQSADVMTLTHPNYPVRELSRLTATTFQIVDSVFAPVNIPPTAVTATVKAGSGTAVYSYVVTSIEDENFEESVASTVVLGTSSCLNDLDVPGGSNDIVWTAPAGATPARYNVYRQAKFGFGLFGFIGQTDGLSFVDDNIEPDYSVTPPVIDDPFTGAGDYPSTVSYFEQRKVFGNTDNRPQNYWFTRSGTENNLARSLPIQDNDSIQGRIVARQVNEIRYFIPLSELLVMTAGAEWVADSSDGSALSPSSIRIRPQSYQGCAKVIPAVTGNSVLYVQADGSRIFAIQYSWESSGYVSSDISIMAPHLVDGFSTVQIAYESGGHQVLWCVRSDGVLLGVTYVPEHEVIAWHHHTTDGLIKSVATVSDDEPYVVVEREVNGGTYQYIERFHDEEYDEIKDYFGVDSGLTYSGAAANTVTGLNHLEGKTVKILGDGSVFPDQVVVNGSVSLPTGDTAELIHVGLDFTPVVELLPLSFQGPAGGQGRTKNPGNAHLRVHRSSDIEIGPDLNSLTVYPQRTTQPYGSPPDMVSEEIQILMQENWGQEGNVVITQRDPLPLTLVSLSLEVEVGE